MTSFVPIAAAADGFANEILQIFGELYGYHGVSPILFSRKPVW